MDGRKFDRRRHTSRRNFLLPNLAYHPWMAILLMDGRYYISLVSPPSPPLSIKYLTITITTVIITVLIKYLTATTITT